MLTLSVQCKLKYTVISGVHRQVFQDDFQTFRWEKVAADLQNWWFLDVLYMFEVQPQSAYQSKMWSENEGLIQLLRYGIKCSSPHTERRQATTKASSKEGRQENLKTPQVITGESSDCERQISTQTRTHAEMHRGRGQWESPSAPETGATALVPQGCPREHQPHKPGETQLHESLGHHTY